MAKIDLREYLERLEEPEDREAVASREYQKELFEQYVQKGDNCPELRAQDVYKRQVVDSVPEEPLLMPRADVSDNDVPFVIAPHDFRDREALADCVQEHPPSKTDSRCIF